ncbi:hypothetical protein OSB04_016607 [Centaurea solstitialis]|uniref:Reverse transcriptase domain-containing protein n=1 Tax=Centaurea solstitialis TaxID=347529 RepID=A0AA38W8N2_9ASTR|nr:hypothetical protein OSB04_016607 [Centaurea solstitialis]
MLRQKAKIKWAMNGDENSKLFHAAIRKRIRVNGLKGLNINAEWIEEPSRVKHGVMDFFKKRFSSQKGRGAVLRSEFFKKLTEEEAIDLEKPFSEEEVLEAIKGCGNNKALGPDGTSVEFVRKSWELIKGDYLKAIDYFWDNMEISEGCNSSFITLIPKVLLSERIKKVLNKLIGNTQSAFLQGRFILDGVLIANEVVEDLRKSKRKGMLFKMKSMGFGEKWRKWVEACLKSASVSILVNGAPTKEFKMTRGIRQGDPLAPFLFLIVAEGLNVLMLEAREKGLCVGSKVGKGVNPREVQDWANDCRCGWSSLPISFLGLPLGQNMNRIDNWKVVIEKMRNKLASWKAKTMSFDGRLTLVKSVLGSLVLYYLSLFRAPRGVLIELERLRSRFFWGGGGGDVGRESGKRVAWVNWARVFRNFDKGGLDVGSLEVSNTDLLVKVYRDLETLGVNLGESVGVEVGSGLTTSFWYDRWLGGVPLAVRFKRIWRLEVDKEAKVADRWTREGDGWSGRWHWRREPRGRVSGELNDLLTLLQVWRPKAMCGDKVRWNLAADGTFLVKSLKDLIKEKSERSVDSTVKTRWSKCAAVRNVWTAVAKWWKVDLSNINSVSRLMDKAAGPENPWLWEESLWTFLYLIWSYRNRVVFKNYTRKLEEHFFDFQLGIFESVAGSFWLQVCASQIFCSAAVSVVPGRASTYLVRSVLEFCLWVDFLVFLSPFSILCSWWEEPLALVFWFVFGLDGFRGSLFVSKPRENGAMDQYEVSRYRPSTALCTSSNGKKLAFPLEFIELQWN